MKRHPTIHKNMAPTQANVPLTPRDLDDPENLILIAQKHFATGFPNKHRAGCPAPSVIRTARADQPPGDELRAHLFHCSECFKEYSAAIRDYYQQPGSITAAENWRTKLIDALSRWRLPLLASAAAALLLMANLFIQRRQQTEAPQSGFNRSQPAPLASTGNPSTPVPPALTARQTTDFGLEKPRQAELLAINLDLNRYKALGDTLRGGSLREEERKIKLPPRRALLKMRLRKGSEAGRYRISVVDPNSKTLIETTARSHDGKSLDAVLDLPRAFRTAHRLRVERGDDLNEYLIEIGPR
ncbi:MAG TPA: hypothetical protein VFV58_05390 [Blastocatellia bacterium]|jgi:hypothetical protein|nr:hypothetical protein [Blastocatellia bacterium]